MAKIRLGTCSPTAADTPQATLALLEKIAHRASTKGVDLLLLPEAFLGSGYPRGVSFGGVLGGSNAGGREAYLQYFKRAVDFGDVVGDAGAGGGDAWVEKGRRKEEDKKHDPSPGDGTREALERIARETGVFLVVGAVEKAGGSLYCAVVYVCPRRGVLGKRRKVQPTGLERLIWSAAGPASLRAVSTEIRGVRINLAAAICWENYMPLVRQALYAQNVNLYLAPTADGGDAWLSLVRTIGMEGRCFVVTSNMCTTQPTARSGALPTVERAPQPTAQPAAQPTAQPAADLFAHWQPLGQPPAQPNGPPAATSSTITTKIVNSVSTNGKTRRRKKSFVLDEDGNEIVLSCQTVDEEEEADTNGIHALASDAPEPPPLPPFPRLPLDKAWERHKHERRRSSVFDEDDNEIVLCRPIDASTTEQSIDETAYETSPRTKVDGVTPAAPSAGKHAEALAPAPLPALATDTRGGSAIVSPFGRVLAGPQWDDSDSIIVADVDFEDCIRGRLNLDVAGHYSRNDSFKFSVEGLDLSPLPY